MAVEVLMPRITHDMTHGVLIEWLKSDGDRVVENEPLFQVETDKAVSEVVSEAAGVLRGVRFNEGDEIPIGAVMAFILDTGEALPEVRLEEVAVREPQPQVPALPPDKIDVSNLTESTQTLSRVIASPIARRIAATNQIDIQKLTGSGPGGRIVKADVSAYLAERDSASRKQMEVSGETPYTWIPLTRYQKTVGRRMLQSIQTIPQFVLEVDVDVAEAESWREHLTEVSSQSISFTALLTKVVAVALCSHPEINSSLDGDQIRRYEEINIGIAMATTEGLLVPIIHGADALSVPQIQHELTEMRAQAKRGQITTRHLCESTFTVSNLGMYGIDRFQAIINPPEAAILAVGVIREMPWSKFGEVKLRPIVNMRLSIDHRILDGASAAPFLVEIKSMLESPNTLLLR